MSDHVVVVGAGPAGRACAATLASAGITVTIVERHLTPGTKACAGGIPRSAWQSAQLDRFDTVVKAKHQRLNVVSPAGRTVLRKTEPFLAVIHRPAWAAAQLEHLNRLGIRLALGTRVLALTDNGVATSNGHIRCDYVIGADGSASRIRRLLGLGPARIRVATLQVIIQDLVENPKCSIDDPTVWFDPQRFSSGYGWCFPAGDSLRVGCGARLDEVPPKQLRTAFTSWLEELHFENSYRRISGASIPCSYVGHRFGRIYLAGDAAGLASPVTGEGIAQAIVSGQEVAREVIDTSYRSPIIAKLAQQHRRTSAALHLRSLGGTAFLLAPHLLKLPSVNEFVLRKYVH